MEAMGAGRRWRRHTPEERRALLLRLAASGQSVSAFCRAESISVQTLRRWQGEAQGDDTAAAETRSGFVDLGALGGRALTIEVDLGGGVVLRVRRG